MSKIFETWRVYIQQRLEDRLIMRPAGTSYNEEIDFFVPKHNLRKVNQHYHSHLLQKVIQYWANYSIPRCRGMKKYNVRNGG